MIKSLKKALVKNLSVIAMMLVVTGFVAMNDHVSFLLKTSVLGFPEHDAFDGTVYPVKKVPNWVKLSSADWDADYNDLSSSDLINTPFYDPSELRASTDSLQWGNAADDEIRNAKITYSVPYMGNYRLDGRENAGSHLAVDMKIPMGTPIYSIANGTVIKVSNITSGFGHHIVVQHNDFPTLDSKNASETLYSSYSHLGRISVSEGDVVDKGDKIAVSGDSGTATTPHLHFQIDNDEAPWHPYWPFTWAEASDAGLDFFSAVNEGLGKSSALRTTINPVKFVQKYMNGSVERSSNNDEDDRDDRDEDEDEDEEEEDDDSTNASSYVDNNSNDEEDDEPEYIEEEEDAPEIDKFDIEVSGNYELGDKGSFKVMAIDNRGDVFVDDFDAEVSVYDDGNNVKLSVREIDEGDFKNGVYTGSFEAVDNGTEKIFISYHLNGKSVKKSSSKFKVLGENDSIDFSDVSKRDKYYDAISSLSKARVISGRPDGTFGAKDTVNRVEALKFILEGVDESLITGSSPFDDIEASTWYSDYLYTAYKNGVVSGYKDGTFRPGDEVNKVEFLKMLFAGMDVEVPQDVKNAPYEDVQRGEWYTPVVAYARDLGLIEDGQNFHPGDSMTRGEAAYAIHQLIDSMK